MKQPHSDKFRRVTELMATGEMVGMNRPITRATWDRSVLKPHTSTTRGGSWRDLLFNPNRREYEFFPVLQCQINRSVGQDAGTCELTLANNYMPYYDNAPQGLDTYGRMGYFTPDRGLPLTAGESTYDTFVTGDVPGAGIQTNVEAFPSDWDFPYAGDGSGPNPFYWSLFVPNRLIRTYQGYGSDNFDENGHLLHPRDEGYVAPKDDTKLWRTGVWLIDRVAIDDSGNLRLHMRDLGKLLIEQVVYPPAIPLSRFPLQYCPATPGEDPDAVSTMGKATAMIEPSANYAVLGSTSNDAFIGVNGRLYGHEPAHALDGRHSSHWLSLGHESGVASSSYEWIELVMSGGPRNVSEVLLSLIGTGYMVYFSVMVGGAWQGGNTIPYVPGARNNGANIPYVRVLTKTTTEDIVYRLRNSPNVYNADRVRLTFTNLPRLGYDNTTPYRAGVREVRVRKGADNPSGWTARTTGAAGRIPDWSDAVRELLGWAGFTHVGATYSDPLLGEETGTNAKMRIWGDIESMGAGPIVCTPKDWMLNKSFYECVKMVTDMLGCVFFIGDDGQAVWRQPNIWAGGNYSVDTADDQVSTFIREWPIEFHENANLLEYEVTIDDSQVRSEVVVIGEGMSGSMPVAGGAVLTGGEISSIDFSNILGGQTRLMMVPREQTKGFKTVAECQRMAELIAVFILFTYRKGRAKIVAHPALEIDDQVRIFERVTNESNVHYVAGYTSTFDAETGSYTMDVTTHWLGHSPNQDWFVDRLALTPAVTALPAILERLAGDTTPAPAAPTVPTEPAEGYTYP